ncbi:MAG: bifunctional tetrahydrofolate synthase/dihydrofolate synthase, partial [Aeromonas veronii]
MSSNMQQSQSRSLVDWLSYLEQIHPVNIDMGLDRVGAVARRMGLTQLPFKVITVAGTNGKGSSCAMAASILMAAGYKVGVYSSPHLLRFTERVRVNGQELPDSDHCAAFAEVEAARGEIALTFFEFATLAGLWLFCRAAPDVLLLEVGLGGRLDATNVVESDVAMITSIALDHCDWLGDTREAVAVEKAGVYRAGKPAISGEPNPPETIASEAQRLDANLRQVGIDFRGDEHEGGWDYHGL